MRRSIAEGKISAEYDIAEDLSVAITTLANLRAAEKRLDEFLLQNDIFGDGLKPIQVAILKFFADNLRSAKNMAAGLNAYAERVLSIQKNADSLFEGAPIPTKTEAFQDATRPFTEEKAAAEPEPGRDSQAAPELHADATGSDREVPPGKRSRPNAGSQSSDEAETTSESGELAARRASQREERVAPQAPAQPKTEQEAKAKRARQKAGQEQKAEPAATAQPVVKQQEPPKTEREARARRGRIAKTEAKPAAKTAKTKAVESELKLDPRFADNKIFTSDKVAAARAHLKDRLGTLHSGMDPDC